VVIQGQKEAVRHFGFSIMANRGQTSSVIKNFKSMKRAMINNFNGGSNTTSDSGNGISAGNKKLKLDPTQRNGNLERSLIDLSSDELEGIAKHLDTASCLNLLRACQIIYLKLNRSPGFWKHLCFNENFHEYTALRNEDNPDVEPRLTWSLELFHKVEVDQEAPKWRRIFQRGIAMRRNICQGKFELWRLFLTDEDSLPVKKMNKNTSYRELRSYHRHSQKAKDPRRRVRIHRYWNEDFLVAVQFSQRQFNDLFVWKWMECQNPKFLYNFDLFELYPQGLFPTAFFLWKHYLVLMPDTGYVRENQVFTSMIRVHDLNDNMKLVGSYDFPEQSSTRRFIKAGMSNETAHLHKLGDKAVALCRIPKLNLFVFNLPNCELLRQVTLLEHIPTPLENDDLDQRFLMKENTMIFMFHDSEFFSDLLNQDSNNGGGGGVVVGNQVPGGAVNGGNGVVQAQNQKRYGKLLFINFDEYIKDQSTLKNNSGAIRMKIDETFDCNDDYIEKLSVMSADRMAVALSSGKVVIRHVTNTSSNTCSHVDQLVIPCPENLKEEYDQDYEEVDTEGPSLCSSRNGEVILIMRHFETGRRIHAYDVSRKGRVLYTIDLDDPQLNLMKIPGYISIDIDGNFLCAADQDKIVIWNSRNGKFIRTIQIPPHYDFREDMTELRDKFCWKGHTDFAFAEDGIIIIHSQRNFPIAADVMLFW